eukprot:7753742-Pyramimonas_sp.AAC.1
MSAPPRWRGRARVHMRRVLVLAPEARSGVRCCPRPEFELGIFWRRGTVQTRRIFDLRSKFLLLEIGEAWKSRAEESFRP